jgi:hypothetical protein
VNASLSIAAPRTLAGRSGGVRDNTARQTPLTSASAGVCAGAASPPAGRPVRAFLRRSRHARIHTEREVAVCGRNGTASVSSGLRTRIGWCRRFTSSMRLPSLPSGSLRPPGTSLSGERRCGLTCTSSTSGSASRPARVDDSPPSVNRPYRAQLCRLEDARPPRKTDGQDAPDAGTRRDALFRGPSDPLACKALP